MTMLEGCTLCGNANEVLTYGVLSDYVDSREVEIPPDGDCTVWICSDCSFIAEHYLEVSGFLYEGFLSDVKRVAGINSL